MPTGCRSEYLRSHQYQVSQKGGRIRESWIGRPRVPGGYLESGAENLSSYEFCHFDCAMAAKDSKNPTGRNSIRYYLIRFDIWRGRVISFFSFFSFFFFFFLRMDTRCRKERRFWCLGVDRAWIGRRFGGEGGVERSRGREVEKVSF